MHVIHACKKHHASQWRNSDTHDFVHFSTKLLIPPQKNLIAFFHTRGVTHKCVQKNSPKLTTHTNSHCHQPPPPLLHTTTPAAFCSNDSLHRYPRHMRYGTQSTQLRDTSPQHQPRIPSTGTPAHTRADTSARAHKHCTVGAHPRAVAEPYGPERNGDGEGDAPSAWLVKEGAT